MRGRLNSQAQAHADNEFEFCAEIVNFTRHSSVNDHQKLKHGLGILGTRTDTKRHSDSDRLLATYLGTCPVATPKGTHTKLLKKDNGPMSSGKPGREPTNYNNMAARQAT